MTVTQLVLALIGIAITLLVQAIVAAIAWGDLRRMVLSDREVARDRHEENKKKLGDIDEKVDRINGTVGRHDEAIRQLRGRR